MKSKDEVVDSLLPGDYELGKLDKRSIQVGDLVKLKSNAGARYVVGALFAQCYRETAANDPVVIIDLIAVDALEKIVEEEG